MMYYCYDHDINVNNIIDAVAKLKNDKFDPIYSISSFNIIHGTDKLYNYLSIVFKILLHHGISNEDLNRSILVPLPKNKRKSLNNSSNYRAIALSSIIGKLLEYVILE